MIRRAGAYLKRHGVKAAVRRAYERFALGTASFVTAPLRSRSGSDPFHSVFKRFVAEANQMTGYSLLELGSRHRVGDHGLVGFSRHVGVDINAGPNVDVVGDIHRLSEIVDGKFDAVYSISVFEHLAMPWKAVLEINKVMNPGGLLFISTHPCWPAHALPWDFYRFQKESFKGLLNADTGFEILACEEGLPARIIPLVSEASTRGLIYEPANLGISVLARKTSEANPGLVWDTNLERFLTTAYPETGHSYL